MAYDEQLAARVRDAVATASGVTEKRMFGGLAFLVDGHLAVSASSRGGLLVRVDPAEAATLVHEDGVAPFEMRGRPMAGWLHVDATVVADDAVLRRWVGDGIRRARAL